MDMIFTGDQIFLLILAIIFLIAGFIALKFELDAGYYECKNCHHKFIPTYKEVMFAMHMSTTRYLKCPKCNKRSWAKKVFPDLNKSKAMEKMWEAILYTTRVSDNPIEEWKNHNKYLLYKYFQVLHQHLLMYLS